MALRVATYFLALSASFFLFYFNVPYWTGRDMADLSKSGIWRALFRFLSFLGYGMYRLCECLCRGIQRPILNAMGERSPKLLSTVAKLINILFYIAFLFLLTMVYGTVMDEMFPPVAQTLGDGSGGTVFGLLSEIVVLLRLFAVDPGPEGWTFANVMGYGIATLIFAVLYVVVNTLFFSILYGLLRNKLRAVDLTKRFTFLQKKNGPAPAVQEPEEGAAEKPSFSVRELGGQLMDAVREFLGKQTQINSLNKNPVLLVLLLLVFLAFSVFMTAIGQDELTLWDVAWQVLDAVQIIPIVGSFIITYWFDRGAVKVSQVAVDHMPEPIRNAVHAVSTRCGRWADAQDAKRAAWARAHDVDVPDDSPAQPPAGKTVWTAPRPPRQPAEQPPKAEAAKAPTGPVDTSVQCPYREYCPMCDRGDQLGEEVLCGDARYVECKYFKAIDAAN